MNVVVCGTGAQGSIIARRLDGEAGVSALVCADYDEAAARRVAGACRKARAVRVDARDPDQVLKLAREAELLVNALPPDFNLTLMRACLEAGAHYQDLASGPVEDTDFVSAVKRQLDLDEAFRQAGLAALINTGSAPGLVSVLARNAADKLEAVRRILICVYDGVWTRRFIPFWWSPQTAFGDMAAEPINYVEGRFEVVRPYNAPEMVDFRGLGKRRVVDHEHEEPVTFGLLSERAFKGCRNVGFKYGGPALELAESLYKMGLLGKQPVQVGGCEVVPLQLICRLTPAAPADPEAIRQALAEGMVLDEGAVLVRVDGVLRGRQTRIDSYVNSPGLQESFEKHGMTHESFLTGQAAFMFSKLFVDGRMSQRGVFPPELLDPGCREHYLAGLARLGITVDEVVQTRLH